MRIFWTFVNVGLIGSELWGGYRSLAPERLRHTNPDAILCGILLVIMPLFSLGCVHYSVTRWRHDKLRRPFLDRNPLNWWHDPLQSLFISTCIMAAMVVGAAIRRPSIGSLAFWTLGTYSSITIGLMIGQLLIYRVFRARIIEP